MLYVVYKINGRQLSVFRYNQTEKQALDIIREWNDYFKQPQLYGQLGESLPPSNEAHNNLYPQYQLKPY